MAIHVMETKLSSGLFNAPAIREIFDEKSIIEGWLFFEACLAEIQGELGIIPRKAAEEIRLKASLDYVSIDRIVEINKKVKLFSVATVRALAEVCEGGAGEYIHYGSCSPELGENTLARNIKKAMDVFEKDLEDIRQILNRLAIEHRYTVMVERTHGQQALPTTFGFVAAIWSDAVSKNLERFREARKRVLVGYLKGAAGTQAAHYAVSGEKCVELEKRMVERLGLVYTPISFHRHMDRLTEFMNLLTVLSVTFDKIFSDIFTQQRSEIGELEEPFDTEHQISSSSLPQKRNPFYCETILAWCKKIRSNAAAFAETHMVEAHHRTGFHMEDLIIPETCILVGSLLNGAKFILEGLVVRKEVMKRNLDISRGLVMTEPLMLELSKKTGRKQTAHAIIHKIAMEAFVNHMPFSELILRNPEVRKYMTEAEIEGCLKPENHLGLVQKIIDAAVKP